MAGPVMNYAPARQPQARWAKEGDGHVLYDGDTRIAKTSKHGWSVPDDNGGWRALDLAGSLREATASSGWLQVSDGVEQSSDGKSIRFQSRGRWIEVY
jgi:hypothetical protein